MNQIMIRSSLHLLLVSFTPHLSNNHERGESKGDKDREHCHHFSLIQFTLVIGRKLFLASVGFHLLSLTDTSFNKKDMAKQLEVWLFDIPLKFPPSGINWILMRTLYAYHRCFELFFPTGKYSYIHTCTLPKVPHF